MEADLIDPGTLAGIAAVIAALTGLLAELRKWWRKRFYIARAAFPDHLNPGPSRPMRANRGTHQRLRDGALVQRAMYQPPCNGTSLQRRGHLLDFDASKPYIGAMTKLLDEAVEAVRRLPSDDQDDIARAIIQLAGSDLPAPVVLSPEEREAIARSKAAADRGEFATSEQVRAVWAKHGL